MGALKVLSLFVLFGCVLSEDESLLTPCAVEDMECLSKTTENFLDKTAAGIPKYDIKAIDPMFLDMVCVSGGDNIMLHYKNITITGLKAMKIKDFKMDTASKSVILSMKEDLDIAATLVVELTDASKTFTGGYTAKALVALVCGCSALNTNVCQSSDAIGTARYNYEIKADDRGVEHFEVGPETITCEVTGQPEVTISPELETALSNDADARSKKDEYLTHQAETRKESVCKIIERAYAIVIHNIRATAKLLPKTAFFTNV